MQWLNEPQQWQQQGTHLTVVTQSKTDFWRVTHYGFIRDNGHFYFDTLRGDFLIEVEVSGHYRDLYDQAGIMLRVDEKHWIKAGIEYVNGIQNLSAVVTHGHSDWSLTPFLQAPSALKLRVERRGNAVHLAYMCAENTYTPFRMAYLLGENLHVGLMCASPKGEGFAATFEGYRIQRH
ncbi:MAG: DUF1349 domain-containing protein [Gloeomargaritaceae cyanobacterium C42_A2020_066]|nr:DUF1349 domain-containing protein [Gloeomargaritaceae cyanobacterium C42_A2020_066]